MRENPQKKPVLVICTKEEWEILEDYCVGDDFYHVLRPVQTSVIARKCLEILNGEKEAQGNGTGAEAEELATDKKKVMVIDDCSFVLRNVKRMLEDRYQVFVATSGEKAMALLPKIQPDLILLDYEMPGWTGKETYQHILDTPSLCDIPVIFLTGVSDRERVVDVLKNSPAGYVLKPILADYVFFYRRGFSAYAQFKTLSSAHVCFCTGCRCSVLYLFS